MVTSKLEVLVDFGENPDQKLVNDTVNTLTSKEGVKEAKFENGAIVIETSLPSTEILESVTKASGKRAVLQGFGECQSAVAMVSSQSCCPSPALGVVRFQQAGGVLVADGSVDGLTPNGCTESQSAVAMISSQSCCPTPVLGVVRFQQAGGVLVADGSVDGLTPNGVHGLHIHDAGDLSEGCKSLGGHFNPLNTPHGGPEDPIDRRHAGDLGNITTDENGRATFRILDNVLKVWDIIGRSVAITERQDDLGRGSSPTSKIDGDSGQSIACGVIARSSGVFQNPKRICACDGVVVWDEKDRPLAGKGRRKPCCGNHKKETDTHKKETEKNEVNGSCCGNHKKETDTHKKETEKNGVNGSCVV